MMAENNNNINSKDFLLGAVMGSVIGAVTALLLAPKSGQELRGDISKQYQQVSTKTQELASNVGEKTKELAGTVSEKSQEWATKAKEVAENLSEDIKSIRKTRQEIAGATETEVSESANTQAIEPSDEMKQ